MENGGCKADSCGRAGEGEEEELREEGEEGEEERTREEGERVLVNNT